VRGENLFAHPRIPDATTPAALAPVFEKMHADEAAFEAKLEAWLAKRATGPKP
jgi:hypothetical protein